VEHAVKNILYLGFFLSLVCAIAAGMLAFTYLQTAPLIDSQKLVDMQGMLQEVLPGAERFNKIAPGVFTAYRGSWEVGQCRKATVSGYSGEINLLVGIGADEKVTGVKILNISETPGLGMKVNDPGFLRQFFGKSPDDELKAKKTVAAVTGATITSQAVCRGVKKALTGFRDSKAPKQSPLQSSSESF
jgi:Na+-translocating ferredoxin:NAD+ oxidoreductase subunit G